jgi:sugar lactone lactonase YvrE
MIKRLALPLASALLPVAPWAAPCASAGDPQAGAPPRWAEFHAQADGLLEPVAAAWHKDGLLVVAESFGSRLAWLRPDGTLEKRTELRGDDGGLIWPHGVECLADGSVLVVDQTRALVVKLAPDGTRSTLGAGVLVEPQGACAARGRVLVADSGHGRVLSFGEDGSYPTTFGAPGRGKGLFVEPVDVAVDEAGRVWVVDAGAPKVACFAPDGALLLEIEGHGPHEGLFARPSSIDWALGHVWVCDRDNHRVQCFTPAGELVHAHGAHALLPHEGKGRLHYPAGLAIAPDGARAALVEPAEDRVQFFGGDHGEPDPLLNLERDTAAHVEGGIAAGRQTLVALEPSGPDARLYDLREAEPIEITRFLVRGAKHGGALSPVAVALSPDARLAYIADPLLSRVTAMLVERDLAAPLRQDPFLPRLARLVDLAALQTVAGMPAAPRPQAIYWNAGEVWVADRRRGVAWVLDSRLELLREWSPRSPRWIDPTAIAVVGERVWVVDRKSRAVRVHAKQDGALLHELVAAPGAAPGARLLAPHGLAPRPDGGAWISDEATGRLLRVDAQLQVVEVVGGRGMGRLQFEKPQGLCVSPDGDLWVVERGNHRVQRLDETGAYQDVFGARLWCLPARQAPVGAGADGGNR